MPPAFLTSADLRAQGLALSIGVAAGVCAFWVGLPLPWMLGPMIATTIAAMSHVPVRAPMRLRPIVIPIIGVLLGSSVTAQVFGLLQNWVVTLVALPVFLAIASAVSFAVYRQIGGYDRVTAFYAAMPGGLNEMLIMGEQAGGDGRRIALAHAARILVVIVFVAMFFGLVLGVSSGARGATQWIPLDALTGFDYAVLATCAVLGNWLGTRLGMPAAPVFGPMILSAAAHIAGVVTVSPPTVFIIAAQVTMGTIIGSRFAGASIAQVGRDIALAMVASAFMLVVAVLFAIGIGWASGIPISQAFLAYSPGGLTEMSLLTLALDQDVTYVSVMHILRITFIIAVAPAIFRIWAGRSGNL
ncbi:AbrB family transcriptional regulator [Loktanella sp. D2R18]|uniref:AbrB family transcriptional regulator n=1 Tax=Rhodobacterales TaxID=204455 RepID=UPI000DEB8803|nr:MULTISPECIES: AbrB family transcriptional regulator [Rhodobacterales]MDO6591436.1 AbrB family transcriptional regulator [Yoonia sp. 1_MG-2023]RBW43498.1 AbrB family transcriptional regulator [Loktanella sp. D2R18]